MKKIHQLLTNIWYYVLRKGKKAEKRKIKRGKDDIMDSITLSNYIIEKYREEGVCITNLKLQKILYYIQGYCLKKLGRPIYCEDIYNWQFGPVVPIVYHEFSRNGYHELISQGSSYEPDDFMEKKIVHQVMEACKKLSSSVLVSKTHQEDPWKYTRGGEVIPKSTIKRYFYWNDPLNIE